MNKHAARLIIPAIIMALFLSSCDFFSGVSDRIKGGEETNTWEDPRGDSPDKVYPLKDGNMQALKALDITKVSAAGKDGALHVTFTLSDSLDDFYSQVDKDGKIHTMSMAEVYIDTDNDASTGGPPPVSGDATRQLTGYDVYVSAMPSLKYKKKDGTEGAVSGDTFMDTKTHEMTGYYAMYFIKQVPATGKALEFNTQTWHANKRKYSSAQGKTLELSVPYEWIGVKAGNTVRICYRDMAQAPASGKSVSEDKLLKLE